MSVCLRDRRDDPCLGHSANVLIRASSMQVIHEVSPLRFPGVTRAIPEEAEGAPREGTRCGDSRCCPCERSR